MQHALCARPLPENAWLGRVPRLTSLTEACAACVAAEVADAAVYDRLLAATRRPDLLGVFQRLRTASQGRHLRAFERCAQGCGAVAAIAGGAAADGGLAVRVRGGPGS